MNQHDIAHSVSGIEKKGTIVALHGVTDNAASLADISRQWKDEWKVILLDTLGHGLSRSFTDEELKDPFAAIVRSMAPAIIEAARTSVSRKVVLFGHSLGGAVASHIALKYPDIVEALILEDPALLTPELNELYLDGAAALVERQKLVSEHVGEAIVELMHVYRNWPSSEYGAWAQGKTQVDRNFVATGIVGSLGREILSELRVPTLLITGDGSDVLFDGESLKYIENLNNPFLASALISEASHTVRRDQPATFYALVDSFLEKQHTKEVRAPLYIAEELREIIENTPEQTTGNVELMRARAEKLLGNVRPEEGIDVESVTITTTHSFELRCLTKRGTEPQAIVFSIHGGGYVAGAARYDDERNSALVETFNGALVASPDYGLAPEYPWPQGSIDCCEALLYLHKRFPDKPIYIYGDSAGSGTARNCVEMLARDGVDLRIERMILLEPCLEPQMTTDSFATYADGPLWTREASETAWQHYIGQAPDVLPYVPSRKAMECMPPTMVIVNPADPLRDEGIRLALDLADAGIPVELHMLPGTFHGTLSAKGKLTWERVRNAIKDFVSAPIPSSYTSILKGLS